jgi:tetratricopeptide (TPR) repeat protein
LVNDRKPLLAAAEATVTKVLSQAHDHALAHLCMGRIQIHTNRAAQGIAECERALALDRNLATAHGLIGMAKSFLGRPEESEAHINEALRLSPRDTLAHIWMAIEGCAQIFTGRDENAAAWFRRAVETNRNYAPAHFWLAAALANLGRLNEAQSATQAGLAVDPAYSISRALQDTSASDNATFRAQRVRLFDGMRRAGVPEE